jgi:zinc protease
MKPRLLALASILVAAGCGGRSDTPPSAAATPSAVPSQSAAAQPASAPRKVRSIEGITEYRLDNGLQVLLLPDPTQSTLTVAVTYLVGSRHEGYGETGMAHLLEHMMFKGTPTHRNVLKLLGEKGARANGTTWYDRTNYFETLPASPENLDWTLALESDRMRNASILPEDLASEFSVVRNEFEMGENNPRNVLEERIASTAYLWHNYGKATIGSRADIERVPAKALHAFYDIYYQPDNAVLVVSGRIDEAAALANVEKRFGSIPRPTRALPATYTIEPAQDGERAVTLRRNGDVHVIGLAYHTVAGPSPDFPAVEAALDLLVRKPSGRLYHKLVETGLASSVDGEAMPLHDPFLAELFAEVRDPKNVDTVERILSEEIEGLGRSPIDAREVERWRAATLKDLALSMADTPRLSVELSEYASRGDWRTLFAYRDRVTQIGVDDVRRVATMYFKASNRTLGTFIPTPEPDRAPLTEGVDAAAAVAGVASSEPKASGESFAATLDNIEARTKRLSLNGGIHAALLPKQTRGGKVELSLALHWGDERSLQDRWALGELLGPMLMRGTKTKSFQDLQDLQDRLKAEISFASSADGVTLRIKTFREQLGDAIDLAAEMLESSALPEQDLEIVRQELLAELEQQRQDPKTIAFHALDRLKSPWPASDPRCALTVEERIAALTAARSTDLRKFYEDFVGAGHAELAAVGDFDPDAVAAQVAKRLAPWQSRQPYQRLAKQAFGAAGTAKSIDIHDKEMTTLALGFDIHMKDTDPDYAAWLMTSQVLGGGAASRAWMRLREHEGLSYGVGTWAYADSIDEVGGFGGYAIVAPQNLAKAKASLFEEFDRMTQAPVSDKELQMAKDLWINQQDTSLANDRDLVQRLSQQAFLGRTTAFDKELREKVKAVTPDDIARVAKKHLERGRLIVVDAGDAAKSGAEK